MSSPAVDPQAPYVRLAVVGLVRSQGGEGARWLLLQRASLASPGLWDPPGGRVERGEDLAEAVVREVQEEAGLPVEVAGPCYAFLTYHKGERLLAVSMACRPGRVPETLTLEPGAAVSARWASAAEWETLARAGQSSWAPKDVRRATRMAAVLLDLEG